MKKRTRKHQDAFQGSLAKFFKSLISLFKICQRNLDTMRFMLYLTLSFFKFEEKNGIFDCDMEKLILQDYHMKLWEGFSD